MGMPPVSNAEVNNDEHHIDELPKKCHIPINILEDVYDREA